MMNAECAFKYVEISKKCLSFKGMTINQSCTVSYYCLAERDFNWGKRQPDQTRGCSHDFFYLFKPTTKRSVDCN